LTYTNMTELRRCLDAIKKDPVLRLKLKVEGKKLVERDFELTKVAKEYFGIINKLMEDKNGPTDIKE